MGVTRTVEKNGGENVNVNFSTGEALFTLQKPEILEGIVKSINSIGYKVVTQTEDEKGKTGLSPLEKKFYFCLFFTVPLFSHMFLPFHFLHQPLVQLALCLPVFITGCLYFGKSAWGSIKTGIPNMDVLIIIGATSAFAYSLIGTILHFGTEEVHNYLFYETAATIITLVMLGNLLEHKSVNQTTSSLKELIKLQPAKALKIESHGDHEHIKEIDFKMVRKGDILQVNTGDKIPVDGIIIKGDASIDESMITGESNPVEKQLNSSVTGGTILVSGNIRIKAERVGNETTMSQIIELVKNAQLSKPVIQRLGDKVSAIFVPAVLAISIITFLLAYFVFAVSGQKAMLQSIAVLVISCPCAMGLATPTALMVGIGRAAKNGVLIKGGNTLENFASVKQIVFDKTGTLSTGEFKIKQIHLLNGADEKTVKTMLCKMESSSSHPIAKSIVRELTEFQKENLSLQLKEQKGIGITATDSNGNNYQLGSYKVASHLTTDSSHNLYLIKNDSLLAAVDIRDELKSDSTAVIALLKKNGIRPILLSGDTKVKCMEIAAMTGITEVYSEQTPEQKLSIIKKLSLAEPTAMVGDGINDSAALVQATVGISIGNASQAAIQSAQLILLNTKELSQLIFAKNISNHTLLTIKQNLFWAFFYNIVAIPIAAFGFLNPMLGALAMAFSDVIVIGNSIRLKYKKI